MNLDDIINGVGRRSARAQAAPYANSPGQQLKKWWIAERSAPVLLEYQQTLLDEVINVCTELRDYIETTSFLLESGDEAHASAQSLSEKKTQLLVYESELERLKYIARCYKRTRLAKIDLTPLFYLKLQETPDKLMSKDEWIYCHTRTELETNAYYSSFLNSFPPDLQSLTEEEGQLSMISEPDFDKPVAIRVKQDIGTVQIGSEEVNLEKNGIFMARFSAFQDFFDRIEML